MTLPKPPVLIPPDSILLLQYHDKGYIDTQRDHVIWTDLAQAEQFYSGYYQTIYVCQPDPLDSGEYVLKRMKE